MTMTVYTKHGKTSSEKKWVGDDRKSIIGTSLNIKKDCIHTTHNYCRENDSILQYSP